MIVKLTEYEVSYLTKNDIFIGKKRFNLIQFEGGKGCNKSCVQDFYFFFFELIHSFSVYFISSLFPLLGVQRSQWHRNENIHVNNQRANNDTDRYYRLFLLSSFFFFFFFLRLEGVVPPADSTKPRSIDPNNAYNPYRCSSIVLSSHRPTKRGYNATLVGVSALQTVKSIFTERARRGAGGRGESLRDFIIRVECSSQKINVEIFVIKGEKDGGRVGYVPPMSTNKSSTLFIDK